MQNLTPFGDIADRYDMLVVYDEKLLSDWVESQQYSTGSMVLASTALALTQFAQSFTDMGRVGNGVFIEGGWKGVGKDILRGLNLAGTAGAVLGRGGQYLRLVQDVEGGLCTYVAQANALRRAGQKI